MKQLNITYEDNEHKELKRIKDKSGLDWRAFIMIAARSYEENKEEIERIYNKILRGKK